MRRFTVVLAALAAISAAPGAVRAQSPAPSPSPAPSLPPPVLETGRQARPDGTAAMATRLADGLRACAAKRESMQRLGCFDDLHGSLSDGMAETRSGERPGAWVVEVLNDGARTAGLGASSVISDDPSLHESRASLFVRCSADTLQTFVAFARPVVPRGTEDVAVRISSGGTEYPIETWLPSQSGAAVGAWTTDDARAALARLQTGRRVAVRVNLPGGKSVISSFETTGMAEALVDVRKACRS